MRPDRIGPVPGSKATMREFSAFRAASKNGWKTPGFPPDAVVKFSVFRPRQKKARSMPDVLPNQQPARRRNPDCQWSRISRPPTPTVVAASPSVPGDPGGAVVTICGSSTPLARQYRNSGANQTVGMGMPMTPYPAICPSRYGAAPNGPLTTVPPGTTAGVVGGIGVGGGVPGDMPGGVVIGAGPVGVSFFSPSLPLSWTSSWSAANWTRGVPYEGRVGATYSRGTNRGYIGTSRTPSG